MDLGIPDPCLHRGIVLIDPLHLSCRIHPPHDDADGPVGGGTAQEDLSLVEELLGIGQMLPHHHLLLRGHGGEEIRALRAEGGEKF